MAIQPKQKVVSSKNGLILYQKRKAMRPVTRLVTCSTSQLVDGVILDLNISATVYRRFDSRCHR